MRETTIWIFGIKFSRQKGVSVKDLGEGVSMVCLSNKKGGRRAGREESVVEAGNEVKELAEHMVMKALQT